MLPDQQARFEILCDSAIGPLTSKVDKVGPCSASDDLLECLQYYSIDRVNTLLWRLSTGPNGDAWRPFTHWFRRMYGSYVLPKPPEGKDKKQKKGS